jgi:deazaflavin-dependent oxidoreductase (nitroreductase family)
VPAWVPYFNVLARRLLSLGVPMGPDVLITVRGRKSGLPRSTPITLCANEGRRGLISPFGETDWVRNLRAAGSATLTTGRGTEEVIAVELGPSEAAAFVRDVLGLTHAAPGSAHGSFAMSTRSTSTTRSKRSRADLFLSCTHRPDDDSSPGDIGERRAITSDGTEIRLTPTEWRLLEALARRAGHLVTRTELLRAA